MSELKEYGKLGESIEAVVESVVAQKKDRSAGQIKLLPNGKYQIRVQSRRGGRRKSISRIVAGTRREAEMALARLLVDIEAARALKEKAAKIVSAPAHSPDIENHIGDFVYLFACNGLYKIGRSANPQKRINKMASAIMPIQIQMLHSIKCQDAIKSERELHALFAEKRVKGEWFELSEIDVEHIKGIKVL